MRNGFSGPTARAWYLSRRLSISNTAGTPHAGTGNRFQATTNAIMRMRAPRTKKIGSHHGGYGAGGSNQRDWRLRLDGPLGQESCDPQSGKEREKEPQAEEALVSGRYLMSERCVKHGAQSLAITQAPRTMLARAKTVRAFRRLCAHRGLVRAPDPIHLACSRRG